MTRQIIRVFGEFLCYRVQNPDHPSGEPDKYGRIKHKFSSPVNATNLEDASRQWIDYHDKMYPEDNVLGVHIISYRTKTQPKKGKLAKRKTFLEIAYPMEEETEKYEEITGKMKVPKFEERKPKKPKRETKRPSMRKIKKKKSFIVEEKKPF